MFKFILNCSFAIFASGSLYAASFQKEAPYKAGFLYNFGGSLDSGGDFSKTSFYVAGSKRVYGTQKTLVSLAAAYHSNDYSFSGNSLGSANPWGQVHTFRVGAAIQWIYSKDLIAFATPHIRSLGEGGADLGDSIAAGANVGLSFRVNDSLSIGPGITYSGQLEDSVDIFPVLVIDWAISDSLSLSTKSTMGAVQGPSLVLDWKKRDDLLITFGVRYEKLRFRLSDANTASRGGVGEDKSMALFGSLLWQTTERLQTSLTAGVNLGGSFEVENAVGDRLVKTDYDPAPFVGINLGYQF